MTNIVPSVPDLLARARANPEVLGELLELYRSFLLIVAQRQINPKIAVRCSPADIVQQTFVEATQAFAGFEGSTEAEFSAWIKRIHNHNLDDLARKNILAKKRNVEREERLHDAHGSTVVFWREPAAQQSTPSQHALKGEQALRLANVLQALPEMQREAIRLRHLEGQPVEEIARHLDRTVAATAGLIKRGLQALRENMSQESWK